MTGPHVSGKCIIIALCFATLSCKDDEVDREPVIDPGLADYVNSFVEAGKIRGKAISADHLEARFETVVGNCGYGWTDPPRIHIDPACWNILPEVGKELLVFHELGHALLERSHSSVRLPNDDYASIMVEDPTTLYNEYTIEKRAYYLDELFRVLTTLPYWANRKYNESTVLNDEISADGPWEYRNSLSPEHAGDIVDSVFSSPSNSLAIHSQHAATGFSTWAYSWKPQGIETGSDLVLKLKVKAENLTGSGAYFAFRADVAGEDYPVFFYTTQGEPILNSSEFQEYSIKVNYYPSQVDTLNIFLMLDGTSSGTVYYDDVELLMYR